MLLCIPKVTLIKTLAKFIELLSTKICVAWHFCLDKKMILIVTNNMQRIEIWLDPVFIKKVIWIVPSHLQALWQTQLKNFQFGPKQIRKYVCFSIMMCVYFEFLGSFKWMNIWSAWRSAALLIIKYNSPNSVKLSPLFE